MLYINFERSQSNPNGQIPHPHYFDKSTKDKLPNLPLRFGNILLYFLPLKGVDMFFASRSKTWEYFKNLKSSKDSLSLNIAMCVYSSS